MPVRPDHNTPLRFDRVGSETVSQPLCEDLGAPLHDPCIGAHVLIVSFMSHS